MCFSAEASFGAGIVLAVIGIATLKKAQSPPEKFFAAIPLLFAVQQISEGYLWLALTDPAYVAWKQIALHSFLFFAYLVWPLWIPASILWLEKENRRRKILWVLTGMGVLSSAYLTYCLFTFTMNISIVGHHIAYKPDYPIILKYFSVPLYAMASIVPAFISSRKHMWVVGVSILVAYIITFIFYKNYVVSVWCFFATAISVAVWFVLREKSLESRPVSSVFT